MVAPREYKENLARIIKEKRESLSISRREFANRAKIPSHSTIACLEKQEYLGYPKTETLEKIAKNIFSIELSEFSEMIEPQKDNQEEAFVVGSILCQVNKINNMEDCIEVIEAVNSRIRELIELASVFRRRVWKTVKL